MKILQINSVYQRGSTGRIVSDIESLIFEEGLSAVVAYGRGPIAQDRYRICHPSEVLLHVFGSRISDRQAFYSKGATGRLIDHIEKCDPDIIHLHNIHGYYLQVQLLFEYLKERNKPIVWTLHDCWPFTGHCAYFDFIQCKKWRTECDRCPSRHDYPKSFVLDSSRRNFIDKKRSFQGLNDITIVTPSEWLARLVGASFLRGYACRVINNGIDLNIFKPTQSCLRSSYGLVDSKVVLGVAFPWSKRKGIDDILKLADLLGPEYRIVLIGLSKKQIKDLPKSILGIERTSNTKELAQWYSSADVFINPTYEDNYPTTNLEAIACGTPVVTYNTGGSPESVIPSTGLIVDKYDIKSLAHAVVEMTSMGKENYAEDCLSHARSNFDKKTKFQEYISLYKELYQE